jgi:hypothetical protein
MPYISYLILKIILIFENKSIKEMASIVESTTKQNKSFNISIRI